MLIGIHGKARSGKDTFAGYLKESFEKKHNKYFKLVAFATQLKRMCKAHFKLSDDQLWGDLKEMPDERYTRPAEDWNKLKGPVNCYWTPREIMQGLGEFYRRIDHKFWVTALSDYLNRENINNAIITDVRHINECQYVKNNLGVLVKVIRESADEIHGMSHISETALDDKKDGYFDITVINNLGLKELEMSAEECVDALITIENMIKKGRTINNG